MLPEQFLTRMEELLGGEYDVFLESYERERYQALRINPAKTERERFLGQAPFTLTPVAWEKNGFYYESTDAPGRHPYHEAGVYYIQEPSAMAPAALLMEEAAEDGMEHRVLDLCAAPGGKSTQIASYMKGKGILICNEIHPARAKILSENVERMGIRNAIVTNETPQKLAEHFPVYFDRILVDAPCSGEGMFRKNEEAREEWSPENVALCAKRQDEILDCAAEMLMPGGTMVYSTCTFAPDENEGSMERFLERHPEFSLQKLSPANGMTAGMLEGTIRLYPHHLNGEGHFLAMLRKEGEVVYPLFSSEEPTAASKDKKSAGKEYPEFLEFAGESLKGDWNGRFLTFGDQLYRTPAGMPSLRGLKVLRPGLHLGTMKKNRFEPSHALALALRPEEVLHTVDFCSGEITEADGERKFVPGREIMAYLNGQSFPMEGEKGWYLVTVDGYSIGWGKLAGTMLKNHYPKGLRK